MGQQRTAPQATFSLGEVAALAGLSRIKVWEDRESGALPASRSSPTGRWHVTRRALIDYLYAMRFPLELIRNRLYPHSLLLTLDDHAGSVATAGFHFERACGSFDLGRLVATRPCWAIFVRLLSHNRQVRLDELREFSRRKDRPHLVCTDTPWVPMQEPALNVFDVVYPWTTSADALCRSLRRMREERRPEGGGGKKKKRRKPRPAAGGDAAPTGRRRDA